MKIPMTGAHVERLQHALCHAFTLDGLRQMVWIGLDTDLEELVPPGNKADVAYNLVIHYGVVGKIHALLKAAVAERPGHEELVAVADEYLHIDFESLPNPGEPDALANYYRALIRNRDTLSPALYDPIAMHPAGNAKKLKLTDIYINLNTTSSRSSDESSETNIPITVLEAASEHEKTVLLGEPGSGKSTFVDYLVLCLAQHHLHPASEYWQKQLQCWPAELTDLVPIPVRLRDFSPVNELQGRAKPSHLWNHVRQWLKDNNLEKAEDALCDRLHQGRVLLLLDGLDEIPKKSMYEWAREALRNFVENYSDCRVVITCRKLAFEEAAWHLDGFDEFAIAGLSNEKIEQYVDAWYGGLRDCGLMTGGDIDRLAKDLLEVIQQPYVRNLATNPFLLTVMAQVHAFDGRLPDSRALLYSRAVHLLLHRDERSGLKSLSQMLAEQGRTLRDFENTLRRVAYHIHESDGMLSQNDPVDISVAVLLPELRKLHRDSDREWAMSLLELATLRSGLLSRGRSDTYTFAHRTLQEYLAGAYLVGLSSEKLVEALPSLATNLTLWREPVLFAAGLLAFGSDGDFSTVLMMVDKLCPRATPHTKQEWRQVWLAGEILEVIGSHRARDVEFGPRSLELVSMRLATLIMKDLLTPTERAAAGRTLGHIGDRRPGVGVAVTRSAHKTCYSPAFVWCYVPAGPFKMGGDRFVARGHWEGEPYDIPYQYEIAKYPVTWAQYELFVNDSGYDREEFWSACGWQWRLTPNADVDKGVTNAPKYWHDPYWHIPNHPVVGLSWYECCAYTHWLTAQETDCIIRLPTEAEWEKAARYPDDRFFPWGNDPRSNFANVNEAYKRLKFGMEAIDTNVQIGEYYQGRTTAVGIYSAHANALGLCDLSGNVWEWLLSAQTSPLNAVYNHHAPEEVSVQGDCRRQLRGGSWLNDIARARLAYRASNPPVSQDSTDGFRLVRDVRFTPAKWQKIQQSLTSLSEVLPAKRERGRLQSLAAMGGAIEPEGLEPKGGTPVHFHVAEVSGGKLYRELCLGDRVSFAVEGIDSAPGRNVKRLFTGKVRSWSREAAFGSVVLANDDISAPADIYVHQNDIVDIGDWRRMKAGDTVEFEVEDAWLYGELVPEARNVRII